jgi:hypothetical protein
MVALVVAGLVVILISSLWFIEQHIFSILSTPYAIAYDIVYAIVRLVYVVLSWICVINNPPFPIFRGDFCKLCHKCELMIDRSHLLVGSFWPLALSVEYHDLYDHSDLEKSALTCHLCILLFHSVISFADDENVNDNGGNHSSRGIKVKIWRTETFWNSYFRLQVCGASVIKSNPLNITWESKGIYALVQFMGRANNVIDYYYSAHRCFDSFDTNSKQISQWANNWVHKCLQDHEICQNEFIPSSQKSYLPLRLVDIAGAGSSPGEVHIVSTATLDPNAQVPYCALSHCWGGKLDVKLTKQNMSSMKKVHVHTLPKNFRDAIAITRQLGCQYLWIDSLNIVQDDFEEWDTQSTLMGLVYANAKCVISATASDNSTKGCFRPRALKYDPCILRMSGNKLLTVQSVQFLKGISEMFEKFVQKAPLSTRGWAFQERYLAGRTLHFGQGHVFFECNSIVASVHDNYGHKYPQKLSIRFDGRSHSLQDIEEVESHMEEWIPPSSSVPLLNSRLDLIAWEKWLEKRKKNDLYTAREEKADKLVRESARTGVRGSFDFLWRFKGETWEENMEFHESWFEIVEQYSVRELTCDTDKEIAIAGIAYFIQQNTGLKYVAGLWPDMLPFNLLWFVSGKRVARPVRSAPTWSWTSVNGNISHTLANPNRKLDIGQGSRLEVFRCPWTEVTSQITNISLIEEVVANLLIRSATLQLQGTLHKLDRSKVSVRFDISDWPTQKELHYLPVMSHKNLHFVWNRPTYVHGILLRAVPKVTVNNRFERVGCFCTIEEDMVEELPRYRNQLSWIEIV